MFFSKKDIEGDIRQRNADGIVDNYCSIKVATDWHRETKGKVKEIILL